MSIHTRHQAPGTRHQAKSGAATPGDPKTLWLHEQLCLHPALKQCTPRCFFGPWPSPAVSKRRFVEMFQPKYLFGALKVSLHAKTSFHGIQGGPQPHYAKTVKQGTPGCFFGPYPWRPTTPLCQDCETMYTGAFTFWVF